MAPMVQYVYMLLPFTKKRSRFGYLTKNLMLVTGVVLIWRGIWYVLDELDLLLFGGGHLWTAIGGVVLGLLLLYLPDKDLKALEKM